MQRLAQFEHHIVGNIDNVGDRPHSGVAQPQSHPQGGWAHGDPGDLAGRKARTAVGRLYAYHSLGGAFLLEIDFGHHHRQIVEGSQIAGYPVDRHGVRPIGCDRDIEDGIGVWQGRRKICSCGGVPVLQHEDAAGFFSEAQLHLRTDHSGR